MTDLCWSLLLAGMVALNWYAVLKPREVLDFLTKPGVMLVLILWFFRTADLSGPARWFWAGLFCALAGDILLNLPEKYFPGGLAAFAAAHVFYTPALQGVRSLDSWLISAAGAVILFLTAVLIYRRTGSSLIQPALRVPVSLYILLIGIMLSSAVGTNFDAGWTPGAALGVSLGAVLFTCSDSIIAWDKFIQPLDWRGPAVRISYHLGQVGLFLGMMLRYSRWG
jgi:uncharacterized membrane protein YhhN